MIFRIRSYKSLCLAVVVLVQACTGGGHGGPSVEVLRTSQGLVQWQQDEAMLESSMAAALKRYQQESSLTALKTYEDKVRAFLDHGFALYHAYKNTPRELPADLIPSLERRTNLLMDIADEYIRQGSLPLAEGIAADVVHNYSGLSKMMPAQRRAEAILLRYRYRQDY